MKKVFCFLFLFFCSLNAGQVTPIDSSTFTAFPAVSVGDNPSYVAVGSTYAFVANSGSNTVTAISLTPPFSTTTLLSVTNPIAIAVGTTYAFVLGSGNPSQINFINQTTLANFPPISIGNHATAIAVGTTYVFATNAVDNTVTVLDQNTLLQPAQSPITVGFFPIDVAVGTNFAYVLNSDDTVTPIDLGTLTAGAPISTGATGSAKIITVPGSDDAFVLNRGDNTVTLITSLIAKTPMTVAAGTLADIKYYGMGDTFILVSNSTTGIISAFDLGAPFFPYPTSDINVGGSPTNMAVGTNFFFVTDPVNNAVIPVSFLGTETLIPINNPGAIGVLGTSNAFVVSGSTGPIVTISPPTNFSGFQDAVRSLFQTDLANVLSWQLPVSGIPAFYKIFRDSNLQDLAGVVNGNVFTFVDHGRKKGIANTYFIVSVDSSGNVSEPASLTIQ